MNAPTGYLQAGPAGPFHTAFDAFVWSIAETDSTMDDAARVIASGAPYGTVLMAEHQRAGRGRFADRTWHDRGGESLLCTVVLPLRPALPVRVGLAVARAIESLVPRDTPAAVHVKWPNDVLLDGRKVSGILCHATANGVVAVGIGINCGAGALVGLEQRSAATSLETVIRKRVAPRVVLDRLLPELYPIAGTESGAAGTSDDESGWRDELNQRLAGRGLEAVVRGYPAADAETGVRIREVTADGSLSVDVIIPGALRSALIHAGEITSLRLPST